MIKMEDVKIYENDKMKMLRSEDYNFVFEKNTGFFARWGKTHEDDPEYGLPEIADIEITTICNGPEKIPCDFCYKKNTHVGKNMSIDTYKKILSKLPPTISQVAFGADATCTSNPDIWKIMEATRDAGIVPNITVANITDEVADNLVKYCGAVACSLYDNKNLCYDSVKKLTDRGMKQVNIHFVLHDKSFDRALELIDDIKNDSRLSKLNAVVFLSLKQKGRGVKYNPMPNDKFSEIINIAIDAGIGFGFDSCSAHKFMNSVKDNPKFKQFETASEPCESSLFSVYIDVDGMFHPCSFSPKTEMWGDEGLSVVKCNDFLKDIWNHPRVDSFRKDLLMGGRNCPLYNI